MFVANAASYLVSVVLPWSVRANFADPERDQVSAEAYRGVLAGFHFVWSDRALRRLALSFMVFIVGMATTIVADPVLADEFDTGSFGFGLITAFWGVGTVVGTWMGVGSPRMPRPGGSSASAGSSRCFGVALSPWFGLVLFWLFAFGVTEGPTQVVEQNLLQRRSPDVVRSRVMAPGRR